MSPIPVVPTIPSSPPPTSVPSSAPAPITNQSSSKSKLLVIGTLILLLVVVLGFGLFYFTQDLFITNSWKGIKPGVTTKDQVVSILGQPKQDIKMPFSRGMVYDSGLVGLPNIVIYDETTGKVEGTLIEVTDQNEARKYYQEKQGLGKPEKIMYSSYSGFSKIVIFPQKGITYSANDVTKMVDGIQLYVPITLADYLSKYGKFFNEQSEYQY